MKNVIIPTEVCAKMLRIAESNLQAHKETVRIYVYLEEIKSSDFWNVRDSASGELVSRSKLQDGTLIWRLYPTHVHCIAFLAEQNGDLLVLGVCNRAEIETVERQLIIDCG